ncbi:MAG: hypothetical protein L6408_06740, partial [Nanoarchaeota archaeon]|nr:hypothetical protein [Nanoarchaeota archaeon]
MGFDLYHLCENKQNKGSLKVVSNNQLKNNIKLALIKIKEKNIKFKSLADRLGINYTTLWKNLNNNNIPLIIIKELDSLSNIDLHKHIIYFYSPRTKHKIKLSKDLNESLAKLIGCVIADGHLKVRKSGRGNHYELIIREEYETNIDAAINWFKDTFDITIKKYKKDNHYFIYLSNKIINTYFTKILGLPLGKKTEVITTPSFIFDSNNLIKKSYLQGLFMFDGGVDYRTGYVNYISKSKNLVKEIVDLLKQSNLEPDYISFKPDRYGRYKIRFRKKEKLKQCLVLFQQNTEKWWRLYEHIYGLNGTTKDLKTLLKTINTYYPKVRKNVITFSDVIKAISDLGSKANVKALSYRLNRNKTVVYEFLKKLERWEIVTTYRVGLKKHYKINKFK